MRRLLLLALVITLVAALSVPPVAARPAGHADGRDHRPALGRQLLPETIELTSEATAESGFQAEGIVARGATAWAGSLATGTIVTANLVTGEVRTLVGSADGPAVGLALDRRGRLWVAGGPAGTTRVYDARSGELVADISLPTGPATFVNDVTVTRDAAYLTDSFAAVIYRVPLDRGGRIGDAEALPLGGEFALAETEGAFNANGIVARGSGRFTQLIIAQSTDPTDLDGSALYSVPAAPDAERLVAQRIALQGDVSNADGLALRGRTLYVVENFANQVARVRLSWNLERGVVVDRITDDDFATPTTATLALGALYVVNARFAELPIGGGNADPAELAYEIVRAPLR